VSQPSPQAHRADIGDGTVAPERFTALAVDGYPIGGFAWRRVAGERPDRAVVIINPATSVQSRYYFRFAAFLFEHGFDVIAYDYRGIGVSRPDSLRGFSASWIDWGCLDCEAVLQYAERSFPGQPILVVGHSIGGVILGLAESNHLIQRVFTMGAQYAYWGDYASGKKLQMIAKWHIAMPLLTLAFGYFPGKRIGWLEDTPKGVVRDWSLSRKRFEDTWRGRSASRHPERQMVLQRFAAVTAPMLAVSVTDDEFGTVAAVERLLAYFRRSPRMHLGLSPQSVGEISIGHFSFFNSRLAQKLWRVPLQWLASGHVPEDCPGKLISRWQPEEPR
jgi:predicted alpha/beta hydrolase